VVNEHHTERGGTERVLEALLRRYPRAEVLLSAFGAAHDDAVTDTWLPQATSVLCDRRKRHYLAPLYARRMAEASPAAADLVLALPGTGWSLGVRPPLGARHLTYAAGIPRALWGQTGSYLRDYPLPARPLVQLALPGLRAHNRALMRRPDRVVANSRWSAANISRRYGRTAEVVYPPVRSHYFTPAARERVHYLAVARLTAQKRIDVLVEAFLGLEEERLVVAGTGPWLERLRADAPPNVSFRGAVEDEGLRELLRGSHALICPSVEEFGIVMAEAHATGVPVIAPGSGGATEIVVHGVTGMLLDRVTPRAIAQAVRAARERRFDPVACRLSGERFSEQRFIDELGRVIDEELELAREQRHGSPVAVG
jgi:glycosyltransferase involved in cell wall biosynthesis